MFIRFGFYFCNSKKTDKLVIQKKKELFDCHSTISYNYYEFSRKERKYMIEEKEKNVHSYLLQYNHYPVVFLPRYSLA